MSHRGVISTLVGLATAALLVPVAATGQYSGGGYGYEHDYGGGGGGGAGSAGGGGSGGGTAAAPAGELRLRLRAERDQGSLQSVTVRAKCKNRACLLDARGRLRSRARSGALKPKRGVAIAAGRAKGVRLELTGTARKVGRRADLKDRAIWVTVTATARSTDGSGDDRARVTFRIRP